MSLREYWESKFKEKEDSWFDSIKSAMDDGATEIEIYVDSMAEALRLVDWCIRKQKLHASHYHSDGGLCVGVNWENLFR